MRLIANDPGVRLGKDPESVHQARVATRRLRSDLRTFRPILDDPRAPGYLHEVFNRAELLVSGHACRRALIVAIVVGIPAGVWSAISRGRLPDHLVRLASLVGGSIPVFWLGLIVIGLFYYQLGWFPGGGRIDNFVAPPPTRTGLYVLDSLLAGDLEALRSSLLHLVLPALTLGYFSTAVIARMTRSSMLEVLGQDYMRTARAKGLQERLVVLRHGLRNALIPTVTILGLTFGSLLSGAVLTETIFSWPGLGRYATAAAIALDFPAVLGVTLLAAIVYPLANLVVDIAYFWLDPRTQRG